MNSSQVRGKPQRDSVTGRLLRTYHEDGNAKARERLVALYLPLVESLARRYERSGVDHDDLVQAGSEGLLKAIDRYDPKHGGEFAAFALPTVTGEIRHHLRDRTATVRLPRRLQELGAKVPRARAELTARLGRAPTNGELAGELQVEEAELARLERETTISAGEPDDLPAPVDPLDDRLQLEGAFEALDDHERKIVQMRFMQDVAPGDVARELGISERQLSRQTQAALEKLRQELEPGPVTASVVEEERQEAEPESEPEPKAQATHSGKLMLRMPQSLHTELARSAEREGVSLNQFITNALSSAVGWGTGANGNGKPAEPAAGPRWLRAAIVANLVLLAVVGVVAVVLLLIAWQSG